MLAIGDRLRDARLRRGVTLEGAQAATRIRALYLAALEEEAWEQLPADAYAKGFLRSYGDWLGLDGAALVAEYRERTRPVEPAIAPAPERIPGLPLARLAAVGGGALVVLAAVGLAGWKLAPSGDPASDPATSAAASLPIVETAPPPVTTAAPTPKPSRPAGKALTLVAANGDCWLQVRLGGPGGKVVWVGTLAQGQRLRFGLRRGLHLLVGAPDAVQARIDGKRVGLPAGPRWTATPQGLRAT